MEYQPGVCNIGQDQRRKRRVGAILGITGGAAVVGWVLFSPAPATYALAAFPFLFGGFVGALQDYFRFCVAFAALARYDLSGSGGDSGSVADGEAVKRDRRRAVRILASALLAAGVATGVGYGAALALT